MRDCLLFKYNIMLRPTFPHETTTKTQTHIRDFGTHSTADSIQETDHKTPYFSQKTMIQ